MLASGSPQRRELLARLGVPFTVRVSGAEELEQANSTIAELRELANKSGMKSLRVDGLDKVKSGITTLNEVYRVTV